MAIHIEFLVEEPSAEAALMEIVPRIVGNTITFQVHVHQGKQDLLRSLPGRLRGYARWLPVECCIVVLIDEDRQDCRELKRRLEAVVQQAGLVSKTAAGRAGGAQVVNRIAVEELEAWFFGDVDALRAAYPGVPVSLGNRARYRDPDAINGGTWEALERVLRQAGHHRSGLPKISVAREISRRMVPEHNRSRSFQVFREGLLAVV